MVANTADRADGACGRRIYPDYPASGVAFTTEANLDAQGGGSSARAASGRRAAGDFGASRCGPFPFRPCCDRCWPVAGRQHCPSKSFARPSARARRRPPVSVDGVCNRSPTIGGMARAKVPAGHRAVSHAAAQSAKSAIRGCRSRRTWHRTQAMAQDVEQRPQQARTGEVEFLPELLLGPALGLREIG